MRQGKDGLNILKNVQEDREADIVAVGGVQVPVMGEENERERERERERLQ